MILSRFTSRIESYENKGLTKMITNVYEVKINLLNKIKVLKDFCTKMSEISDCTPELFLCESEEKLVFLRDILNLA